MLYFDSGLYHTFRTLDKHFFPHFKLFTLSMLTQGDIADTVSFDFYSVYFLLIVKSRVRKNIIYAQRQTKHIIFLKQASKPIH